MLYLWLMLAATSGQTQPTAAAPTQPAAATQPAVTTRPASAAAPAPAPAKQPAAVAAAMPKPVAVPPAALKPAMPAATKPPMPAAPPQPSVDALRAALATQPAAGLARTTTQPATGLAGTTTQPAGEGAASNLNGLTGSGVGVEVTSDGNIILTGDPKDLEILQEFIRQMDAQPVPTPVMRIVKLESAQASGVALQLPQFWEKIKAPAKGGAIAPEDRLTIIPEARSNSLMIAATEQNMPQVLEIIKQLDQPSMRDFMIEMIPLKSIKAVEAETTLKELFKARATRQGVTGDLFDIKADPRTNTLLISAPKSDLETIKKIIDLIDVEPTAKTGGVVKLAIYPLEKTKASEMAPVLIKMLQADSDQAAAAKEQIRRLQIVLKGKQEKELTPLDLEKPIKIFNDEGTNSIIVASIESNLAPIGELIKILDSVPLADELLVKIYPLVHADADSLLVPLKAIFADGSDLAAQPGRTIPGRISPTMPGEALAYKIGLVADKRSNTIIVSGRPQQILLVEQIIKAVDVKQDASKFPPRLVQLEHADAKHLADAVLQKIADQRDKAAEKLGPNAQEREKIVIIPDTRTNSLIVIARDDNFEEIVKLTKQLDGVDPEYLGQIRIINLENLTAADLASKIKDLWEGRSKIRREGGLSEDKPVIVTDSRSNSLVIASNREDFELITHLIKELEQQKLSPMADIRPLIIKNNDVTKLADTITKLFDERRKMSLAKGEEEQPSDRIAIVPDAFTKTLLIASSKSNYDEVVRLVTQLDVPPSAEGVFRTFYIKNADVTKTATMLKELFDKGLYMGTGKAEDFPESMKKVNIIPDIRSSALIVSAAPENLAIIEEVLKQIDSVDTPQFQADVRLFKIEHADAVSVADMLTQLFEGMKATMKEDKDQLEIKIVPNVRSNTVMVSGSRYAIKRAEQLIPTLDQVATSPTSLAKVYTLKQSAASKLAPVMTELFDKRTASEAKGKTTPITILADDSSNSLIVTASRDDHSIVEDLLSKLDVQSTMSQQLQIIGLKVAKAEGLAETLTKLLEKQKTGEKGVPGFAITPEPRTNSLVVFAPADLMLNIRSIVEKLDNAEIASEKGLRVFKLQNAKAEELAKRLDQFFKAAGTGEGKDTKQMIIKFWPVDPATGKPIVDPETGQELAEKLVHQDITITPDPDTNSLMVMAPEGSIDMMQMLIEMLDSVKPVTAEIQTFALQNADATEMQKLLEDLFESKGGGGGGGKPQRTLVLAGNVAAAPNIPATSTEGGTAVEVSFAVDQRTNTLIAAGSSSYLKIVEDLVLKLDYKEIEERTVRVVHLKYGKSDEVAKTMEAYFKAESTLVEKAAEGEAAPRQLQRQVTIQGTGTGGGEGTGAGLPNALLLSYSPRMESQVLDMINQLDLPPPQVMIQVLVAEVTLDDRFELGMEFALQDLLFSTNATTNANGIVEGDNFDTTIGTDVGAQGSGSGISFTVTGEDFNFLFHALQTEGRVEVLSRPSIMVRDNQEANIKIGDKIPTVSDIVVTSGIAQPTVTYVDVGILLTVTPIINPDGFVNLEISPEISSLGPSINIGNGVSLPSINQRKAETSVTVKDGETIIIGGLITNTVSDSETKVPILGDIPYVGNAFRATVKQNHKTELLIVVTPHVVLDPAQARAVSVHMRDQTGLNDNIRRSPLMQKLQVSPEEDLMGPIAPLKPGGEPNASPDKSDEQGPELEEFGPPTTMIEAGPSRASVAVRQETK